MCYLGYNSVVMGEHPDNCWPGGPLYVTLYLVANINFNILIIMVSGRKGGERGGRGAMSVIYRAMGSKLPCTISASSDCGAMGALLEDSAAVVLTRTSIFMHGDRCSWQVRPLHQRCVKAASTSILFFDSFNIFPFKSMCSVPVRGVDFVSFAVNAPAVHFCENVDGCCEVLAGSSRFICLSYRGASCAILCL